jgi:HEAT repeat protein
MGKRIVIGCLLAVAAFVSSGDARSDGTNSACAPLTDGFKRVYGNLPACSGEFLSTPERIKSIAKSGAPTAVWETLEHGETVECLDCISQVEPLLYDDHARTREIAAWWLRRRVFGVFGPGETYEKTVNALKSDPDPRRRAYAANALGEFLAAPGIAACAQALGSDADPGVRAAAATALGRLNDDGGGALGKAMSDADARVKIAALGAAGRINAFTSVAGVAALTGDGNAQVRKRAVELLDSMRAKDSVAAVAALAKGDADEDVRISACHALGSFQDASTRATLEGIAQNDASSLVRDQAKIALRRL